MDTDEIEVKFRSRKQRTKIVYFGCLAMCVGAIVLFYAVGYRALAAVAAIGYALEAWWVWRRHFGRGTVR